MLNSQPSTTVQISVGLMLGVSIGAHLCLYVHVMPEKNDLITLQLTIVS